MCGIVGYIGNDEVSPILLNGLAKLEYRGYDSAGIAVLDNKGKINVVKEKGRLAVLSDKVSTTDISGTLGIGHTRWATHGEPSALNSHPHFNKDRTIAVVHNGIIENYAKLKLRFNEKYGYVCDSQTDTEIVAHMLDHYYKKTNDPLEAISQTLLRLEGSYALGIIFADYPDTLFATRKDSPLVVGCGNGCNYIASDAPAILNYTRDVVFLDNYEIAKIERNNISFYTNELDLVTKEKSHIDWDVAAAEKGGYAHFMLKEIYEQPKAVRDTVSPKIRNGRIVLDELNLSESDINNLEKIYIVACGSAYHVGVSAKYIIEKVARIPVEVDMASEFRYRDPVFAKNSLCIIISQSGETADSLAALREAKANGVKVLSVVNVVGSSIARESDSVIYTCAGPEIAVATTKAYSAQLSVMYLLCMYFADVRKTINEEQYLYYVNCILSIPDKITECFEDISKIQHYATTFSSLRDLFFIGRGIDYAAALEACLKLKEISYIHSETYAAGELKHGTISLIEDGTLVISLASQPALYDKLTSNVIEVKSRGAFVLGVTTKDNSNLISHVNDSFIIPDIDPLFATSLEVIPMQFLSYYIAVARGFDPDKPRNLAKSVTVE